MKKIIAANWKDNGSKKFIKEYFEYFHKNLNTENEILIFPPDLYIDYVNQFACKNNYNVATGNNNFCVGSQKGNLFNTNSSQTSFTSGNNVNMFLDNGCSYILYGHSEVRSTWCQYSDGSIGESLFRYINNNLQVIFCVGESEEEKIKGKTQSRLSTQLDDLCDKNNYNSSVEIETAIIAYEPVWAIGTGNTPKLDDISFILRFIKTYVSENHPFLKEKDIMVLYGGSVNSKNAKDILSAPYVDGVLIGGASLDVKEFTKICNLKI